MLEATPAPRGFSAVRYSESAIANLLQPIIRIN